MSTVREETKALFQKGSGAGQLGTIGTQHSTMAFVDRPDVLEMHDANDRRLRALDPTGRQMVISCGCALFNARVGLAADRVVQVDRVPDSAKPDLLADSAFLMNLPHGRRW